MYARFVELMVKHMTTSVCSVLTQPMLEWSIVVHVETVTLKNLSTTSVHELEPAVCVLILLAVRQS